MSRMTNSRLRKGRSEYSELFSETSGVATSLGATPLAAYGNESPEQGMPTSRTLSRASKGETEHELATLQFGSCIYDAVMVAAFGGVKRRHGKYGKPKPVHPCFCFLLCIPLFILQVYLIIFLLLDFDKTIPLQPEDSEHPAILFAGKMLMVITLQLILFDEFCQSVRSLFMLINPLSWTDIQRFDSNGAWSVFTTPACLAPFPVMAMFLKILIFMIVQDASLSVVLASRDVPTCIMNGLTVVFIAELDEKWWSLCATTYEFEDILFFQFELYDDERRREERSASWFHRCLGKNLDSKISRLLTILILSSFYFWQALLVATAVDTNVLPIARQNCAIWHLLRGKSEYHLDPTVFQWSITHLIPWADITNTIIKDADPHYNGYCNEDYKVMGFRDLVPIVKNHPRLTSILCGVILLAVVVPNICFYCGVRMSSDQGERPSRTLQGSYELDVVTEMTQESEERVSILEDSAEQARKRIIQLESESGKLKELERVLYLLKEEHVKLQEKGTNELSGVNAEISKLRNEFQEEARKGHKFMKELTEFQEGFDALQSAIHKKFEKCDSFFEKCDSFANQVKEVESRVHSLEAMKEDLTELRAKMQYSGGHDLRKNSMESTATIKAEFSPAAVARNSAAGSESRATVAVEMDRLADEDLNTTQPVGPSLSSVSSGRDQPAGHSSQEDTTIPDTSQQDVIVAVTPVPSRRDLSITGPPGHSQNLHQTVPPAGFAVAARVPLRSNDTYMAPSGLDHTVPPLDWPAAGPSGGNADGQSRASPRTAIVPRLVRQPATEHAQRRSIDHTIPPAGWPAGGKGGGRETAFSFDGSTDVDGEMQSRLNSLVQTMKEQVLSELRQSLEQVQHGASLVSASAQTALIESRDTKSPLARSLSPKQNGEDTLSMTTNSMNLTTAAASAEQGTVQAFRIHTMPDGLESRSTLEEAARYTLQKRPESAIPTAAQEVSRIILQNTETRHHSYNPPLRRNASSKVLPSVQNSAQSVVLPSKSGNYVFPVGPPQQTTPVVSLSSPPAIPPPRSLSESSSTPLIQGFLQSGLRRPAGSHETAANGGIAATVPGVVHLTPRNVSRTLMRPGEHAVAEQRSRSVQSCRLPAQENRLRSDHSPPSLSVRKVHSQGGHGQ